MKVSVEVKKYEGNGGLKGFANVTFEHEWFMLKTWGWQIMLSGRTGTLWVRTRQVKVDGIYKDRNYTPLNQKTRSYIERAILKAYNALKANENAKDVSFNIDETMVQEMINHENK